MIPEDLKEFSERALNEQAEKTAQEWAEGWAYDWGRMLPILASKIGYTPVESLRLFTDLAVYGSAIAQRDYITRQDVRAKQHDAHIQEVRAINEIARQTNAQMLEVVRTLEPVLKRLSLPWYRRIFS